MRHRCEILRPQAATPAIQGFPANVNRFIAESQRCSELRVGGRTGGLNVGNPSLPIDNRCLKGQQYCEHVTDAGGRKTTLKSLSPYVKEHFPNAAYGVYPIENDSKVAIVVVANKYSPNNFW